MLFDGIHCSELTALLKSNRLPIPVPYVHPHKQHMQSVLCRVNCSYLALPRNVARATLKCSEYATKNEVSHP